MFSVPVSSTLAAAREKKEKRAAEQLAAGVDEQARRCPLIPQKCVRNQCSRCITFLCPFHRYSIEAPRNKIGNSPRCSPCTRQRRQARGTDGRTDGESPIGQEQQFRPRYFSLQSQAPALLDTAGPMPFRTRLGFVSGARADKCKDFHGRQGVEGRGSRACCSPPGPCWPVPLWLVFCPPRHPPGALSGSSSTRLVPLRSQIRA